MAKITPFLWYDNQAEEAVNFYLSIFKNSRILSISRYGEGAPAPKGSAMTVTFQLEGQDFIALNAGPHFKFNEAISFFVTVDTQAEVDRIWEKLTEGGKPSIGGWLKDKYGLSWQVVPAGLNGMLKDPDPAKKKRVMDALLKMNKIDIGVLERAFNQE